MRAWLIKNKEWVFSGVGVALISAIITLAGKQFIPSNDPYNPVIENQVQESERSNINIQVQDVPGEVNISVPPPFSAVQDSKIQLVDYSVSYPEGSPVLQPSVDIKLRNIGEKVAFIKEITFKVVDQATFEDCNQPMYMQVKESATYEIDLLKEPSKKISHAIKPNDVDRIKVDIFRSEGGPTLTVYKTILHITYDEDDKMISSEPFFLKMVGPSMPVAMTTVGVSEEEWDKCVARNRENFDRIGYQIYED